MRENPMIGFSLVLWRLVVILIEFIENSDKLKKNLSFDLELSIYIIVVMTVQKTIY